MESDQFMRSDLESKPWLIPLGIALGTAILAAAGVLAPNEAPAHPGQPIQSELPIHQETIWAAAAPGRVEPKGRELRIVAPVPAVIKEVLVALNDRVQKGDLLIRLDDEELRARLSAVKAQVAVRTTERDFSKVTGLALDHRKALDSLYLSEQSAVDARMELDRLISEFHTGKASLDQVKSARDAAAAAEETVEQERQKLKKVQAKNPPALTREEAALAAARAEVSVLSANLERMRIRSPIIGNILELNAKPGEMAGSSAEIPLLALGDTSHLQVRAEVEERDVSKIYNGQAAVVKSDAFLDRRFDVRVSMMAKALGAPQLAARSRKQTDVDVLEVVLDLEDGVPLLPGMRVDVFFREADAMPKTSLASPR
jgi:HlyD family secretion protein